MMRGARLARSAVVRRVAQTLSATVIMLSMWWAIAGWEPPTRSYPDALPSVDAALESAAVTVPGLLASALGATLRDELFPTPPPAETPPPLPTLSLELIAITGAAQSDGRRAFLFDKATQKYLDVGVGESVAEGGRSSAARLLSLGDRHALFELAGREVRVEMTP